MLLGRTEKKKSPRVRGSPLRGGRSRGTELISYAYDFMGCKKEGIKK